MTEPTERPEKGYTWVWYSREGANADTPWCVLDAYGPVREYAAVWFEGPAFTRFRKLEVDGGFFHIPGGPRGILEVNGPVEEAKGNS